MVGSEDCERPCTHLRKNRLIAEKFPARRLQAIRQATELKEFDNVHWIPRLGNPADGLPKLKSDVVPLLRLIESGSYNHGTPRPLNGAAFREQ